MPYAAKAKIEHEFDTDHLNVWLTFRHPMDQSLMPPLALWLLEVDDVAVDIVNSAWQDQFTLLLTSDTIVAYPERVLLEYAGPNSNLQTTWGKDWEPWGPILSADIGKGLRFVDRGDPATVDFGLGDFTADDTWHELDLSGIVDEGTKAIAFCITCRNTNPQRRAMFKKKGNVNVGSLSILYSQNANIYFGINCTCPLSTDGKIEYNLNAGGWNCFDFRTLGWWF